MLCRSAPSITFSMLSPSSSMKRLATEIKRLAAADTAIEHNIWLQVGKNFKWWNIEASNTYSKRCRLSPVAPNSGIIVGKRCRRSVYCFYCFSGNCSRWIQGCKDRKHFISGRFASTTCERWTIAADQYNRDSMHNFQVRLIYMLMWCRPIHVGVAAGSQQSRALCVADHDEERGDLHRRAAGVTH